MRRTMGQLVVAVLMAMLAAGCGSSSDEEPSAGAPATTAAPVTTSTPPATATSTTATSATSSGTAARCSNGVLLRAAQQALKDSGSTVTIGSVTVTRCRW